MKGAITPKLIRSDMRKLMKCMDYALKKAEQKGTTPLYYDIYQLLGGYTWGYICDHCEHEYRESKKYTTGRCKLCGKIRRPNESKNRIRKQ